MSGLEVEDDTAGQAYDDSSYKACYIYQPCSNGRGTRPIKKRRLDGNNSQKSTWPLLSGERTVRPSADKRESAFKEAWALQESRIDNIINYIDHEIVKSLQTFLTVNTNSTRASDRVKTALLLSSVDGASHNIVVDRLRDDNRSIVVQLQARQCSTLQAALKHIIKLAIIEHAGSDAYKQVIATNKPLIPMNFDLELLQTYVQDHRFSNIVVAISDIEVFDSHVAGDLFSTLHQWRRRIPFVLLLGITSTTSLFQRRLSKKSIRALDARVFDLAPSPNIYSDIIRVVQAAVLDKDGRHVAIPSLSPSIVAQLQALTDSQGLTTRAFKSAIKYTCMSHFFANPLSTLTATTSLAENGYLAELVRNTDSFRKHCEKLLRTKTKDSTKHLKSLLEDDQALLTEVHNHISANQARYSAACETIAALADLHNTVCTIDGGATITSTQTRKRARLELEIELYQSLHDLTDSTVYTETEAALHKLSGDQTKSHLAKLTSELARQLTKDIEDIENSNNQAISNTATTSLNHLVTSASLPTSPSTTLLHESWLPTTKSIPLRSKFDPAPRTALERALLRPQDYLAFNLSHLSSGTKSRVNGHNPENQDNDDDNEEEENEEDDQNSQSSQHIDPIDPPAASILMTLLQEAPVTINVRDLYDAFESRLLSQQTQARVQTQTQTETRDQEDDQEKTAGKEVMVQFYRALAALKMLGFVKGATGQTVQRRGGAGARNRGVSRGRGGDVDFIAKTSWAGL